MPTIRKNKRLRSPYSESRSSKAYESDKARRVDSTNESLSILVFILKKEESDVIFRYLMLRELKQAIQVLQLHQRRKRLSFREHN